MSRFARQFGPVYEAIRRDIFKFCALMNFRPTWQQAEVLALVQAGHKRIAVKSGQGPGKTTCSVIVGLWRTLRHVDALTVVTAPTMRQAKGVWLSECRRLMEKADPALQRFIEVTKSSVQVAGRPDWGVRLVTATRAENAQGLHQDNLSVIVEEASGIERDIIEQFQGTLTNEDALLFMIGNPNTRSCAFFDCFNSQRHRWATLTLNAEESPIVSRENIEHMREVYGEDSDVYRIRVLGEFPLMDPNCVISSEDCERATDKRRFLECVKMHRSNGGGLAKQFGIDLARFGSDESVIYRRLGNAVMPDWRTFSKVEPGHVIEHAFKMQSEAMWSDKECWYVPDAGGMGQGVMSKLYDARKQVFEFHTQGASSKPDYANRMTEAWFHVADLFKKGHIYIPKDNRLIQQLSTRQYHITKKGKLIVESKEDYKKRSTDEEGASPDRADALVMAFYDQVVVRGQVSGAPAGKTVGMRARIA